MRVSAAQLEFTSIVEAPVRPAKPTWGGARAGAGRPRKAEKDRKVVPHHARAHKLRHPVHITVRARRGLPSFRSQRIHDMVRRILNRQLAKARYREQFQVVHYSVQSNHLHLIVEATDARSMRSGVSGLVIAFAKRLNREILRRLTGKVWGDRYHSRELTSPSAVRRALVYVLQNVRKHGFDLDGRFVDPLSSAKGFDGWTTPVPVPPHESETFSARRPRTWLLGEGWSTRGGGPLSTLERPA